MSKTENPTEEQVKQWQAEWIELVHGGTCCASVIKDPHQELKDKLIEEIRKEKSKE